MKLVLILSTLALTSADTGKPQITLGLTNNGLGKFGSGSLGGLEPALKWQTKGSIEDVCDWEAGLNMQIDDLNTTPYSYWGKIKKRVAGVALSARGAVAPSRNDDVVDVELRADGGGTSVQLTGKAGAEYSVSKVNVRQTLSIGSSKLMVNPRYNVAARKADVGVTCSLGNTSLNVDSSNNKLTVAQLVGDKNVIIPTITTNGEFDVAVQRSLGEGLGTITTAFKPREAINLKWEEGPWVATVTTPMNGMRPAFGEVDASFKRKMDL